MFVKDTRRKCCNRMIECRDWQCYEDNQFDFDDNQTTWRDDNQCRNGNGWNADNKNNDWNNNDFDNNWKNNCCGRKHHSDWNDVCRDNNYDRDDEKHDRDHDDYDNNGRCHCRRRCCFCNLFRFRCK